ncbi:MAG: tetratricopeptide repeat protein [Anaerolineales bacterium]
MSQTHEKLRYSNGGVLSKAERYLERALSFYEKNKFEDALADLNEALRLERRNAELYATRGYIYLEQGNGAAAEADFKKALSLDPSQWIVHYARARQALRDEQPDAALGHLNEAQRFAPLRPEVLIYRAISYYYKSEKQNALREIEGALDVIQPQKGKRDKRATMARKWRTAIKKL